MTNNVFEFRDLYFKQKQGTAMGTPVACIYATIYYGYYKKNFLLPKYGDNIMIMKRFIDDMFVVWTGTPTRLQEFQEDLPFGLLTWDSSQPSNSVDFLDLTISINVNRQITTKTYQKALNLYLYIPAASAHPNRMVNGIIYSLIKQFYNQNSEHDHFNQVVALLYKRFCARGWEQRQIKKIILEAVEKAQKPLHQQHTNSPPPKQHFLHLQYHPHDIPRKELQHIFEETCTPLQDITTENGGKLAIPKITVAYSRAKNLGDLLRSSKLHQI